MGIVNNSFLRLSEGIHEQICEADASCRVTLQQIPIPFPSLPLVLESKFLEGWTCVVKSLIKM